MPLVHRFRAMGTDVTLQVLAAPELAAEARHYLGELETWFGRVESILSRFRPESELSRLNGAPGRFNLVSPVLGHVLATALEAARRTEGLYDPTVLPALEAAGYDRPLTELDTISAAVLHRDRPRFGGEASSAGSGRSAAHTAAHWIEVRVGAVGQGDHVLVDRPPGIRFDFGGIAKGWTADRAARWLSRYGPAAANAGGDARLVFPRRRDHLEETGLTPWPVEVADPFQPERTLARFWLRGGAVVTSDVLGRRWRTGRGAAHHIIDPRTGLPAETDVVAATVLARTAVVGEALAKACVILGSEAGLPFVESHGALALVVRADGSIRASAALGRYLDAVCNTVA